MKRYDIESRIIAAAPHPIEDAFVQSTMQRIKHANHRETFSRNIRRTNTPKRSLFMKIKALHGASLAVAIITATLLLTGVVYAAVRFTPGLLNITGKSTNSLGETEYTVQDFDDCHQQSVTKPIAYKLKEDAPDTLTDDDVLKILQARCEINWVSTFASKTWPTYGENKKWKDGDSIFYTRPDVMGEIAGISTKDAEITFNGAQRKTYKTFDNKDLRVYLKGAPATIADIKPSDTVFTIGRVRETYIGHRTEGNYDTNPTPVGLVAVVKLSLPTKYYENYQHYIQEIYTCHGNDEDRCENGSSIDVFPRDDSEGASNPKLVIPEKAEMKQIAGEITAITDTYTLITASSGRQFTINLPKDHFDTYNQNYAPNYTDLGDKALVQTGRSLAIGYYVHADVAQDVINEDMIMRISLVIPELNPKGLNYKTTVE